MDFSSVKALTIGSNNVKQITDSNGNVIWKKQTLPYVTNGLVLYLDGINNTRSGHNPNSRVWEDLSGNNNDFNLGSGVVINANSMTKTTSSSDDIISQSNTTSLDLSNMTVEVFYSVPSTPLQYNRLLDLNGELVILQTASLGYIRVYTPYGDFNSGAYLNGNTKYSIVAKCDNLSLKQYHNNNLYQQKVLTGTTSLGGMTAIGSNCYLSGERLACTIYAVRVYNRALTDAELTQNYNADLQRFDPPETYIDCEYIESHGQEYIITDFYGDYRYTVETKFQYTANENDKAIFGAGKYGGLNYHMTWYQQRWYMNCAHGYESNNDFGVPCTSLTEVSFNTSNRKVVLNDIIFSPIAGSDTTDANLSIFGRKVSTSSNPTNLSKARMYYFNIYDYTTNQYVAKLKPVYKQSSGEVGLYDTINNKFYGNNGSGAFTKEP